MSDLPTIDEAYTRRIYDALTAMEVDLDSDPLQYGPKRLNGKVAATRRHLSRCQQIYMQMADDLQRLNRAHRALKLDYDLQLQDMLSNDPDVRSNKNIRDQAEFWKKMADTTAAGVHNLLDRNSEKDQIILECYHKLFKNGDASPQGLEFRLGVFGSLNLKSSILRSSVVFPARLALPLVGH